MNKSREIPLVNSDKTATCDACCYPHLAPIRMAPARRRFGRSRSTMRESPRTSPHPDGERGRRSTSLRNRAQQWPVGMTTKTLPVTTSVLSWDSPTSTVVTSRSAWVQGAALDYWRAETTISTHSAPKAMSNDFGDLVPRDHLCQLEQRNELRIWCVSRRAHRSPTGSNPKVTVPRWSMSSRWRSAVPGSPDNGLMGRSASRRQVLG